MECILFMVFVAVLAMIVLLIVSLVSLTQYINDSKKHFYYIIYINAKYNTCQPDYESKFFFGSPKELECEIWNKPVETIIKLD